MTGKVRTHRDNLVVFTDLDGTLLDHATYAPTSATEALEVLEEREIPIILCSSKTRAEIELLQLDLRLAHPFISENGGAIFLREGYFPFAIPDARRVEGYQVIEFGAPYGRLVEALKTAAGQLGLRVQGFSDMSIEELSQDGGLSPREARLAKMREYDEAFRILDGGPAVRSRLFQILHKAGLRCTRGGRYHHVTGVADKGQAVRRLKEIYQQHRGSVTTIGLGDSLNDLSLLREVDIPIIVRNPAAGATARLFRKVPTARLTHAPGPQGWNEAILDLVGQRLLLAP